MTTYILIGVLILCLVTVVFVASNLEDEEVDYTEKYSNQEDTGKHWF